MSARRFVPPLPLLRLVDRFRGVLTGVHRRTVPPSIALMDIAQGGFLAQTLCATAELGVADALAAGPLPLEELAERVGARPETLRRLLRPLLAEWIFSCRGDVYALNSLAQPLRGDAAVSVRHLLRFIGDRRQGALWAELANSVRTGEPAALRVYGMPFFDYLQRDREFGELFDAAMTGVSETTLASTLAAYDFSAFGTIVDIAGGHGRLLADILRRTPGAKGVLFDTPDVVAAVPRLLAERGLTDRCAVVGGSFFVEVPRGGDAYLLKHIVHDWPDEQAVRILSTVRKAMADSARLLVIEFVLPRDTRRHFGNLLDLEMLLTAGGRERTEAEFRELLAAGGFELLRHVPTASMDDILEARPV
ncbi:acetylserotonin O-methyltransferase [Nocardia sp. CDC159]|uniref:Acetylserotonin O-methyltransferase n=1 Tax=Nocardia pulmonis TaxID=2951408 RepID=A0A9X2E7Q1_9NOCA|nr:MULTISPECIES: acetylserotonin O-methyltransferase [Nocardia]MCM6774738.1 acetylserotonin O-methyltransferase [Nocardia pulmonis]MCM6787197.1 acetylserotonin O-methyltransferase [Nocardia sp. CDC159]